MVSDTVSWVSNALYMYVLILVVVEYGLGHLSATVSRDMKVLILVVVEYGLGHIPLSTDASVGSLNPCCSGIWSRTT